VSRSLALSTQRSVRLASLNRIDLFPRLHHADKGMLNAESLITSARAREMVLEARERQNARFAGREIHGQRAARSASAERAHKTRRALRGKAARSTPARATEHARPTPRAAHRTHDHRPRPLMPCSSPGIEKESSATHAGSRSTASKSSSAAKSQLGSEVYTPPTPSRVNKASDYAANSPRTDHARAPWPDAGTGKWRPSVDA
jgi:hypothetical protein